MLEYTERAVRVRDEIRRPEKQWLHLYSRSRNYQWSRNQNPQIVNSEEGKTEMWCGHQQSHQAPGEQTKGTWYDLNIGLISHLPQLLFARNRAHVSTPGACPCHDTQRTPHRKPSWATTRYQEDRNTEGKTNCPRAIRTLETQKNMVCNCCQQDGRRGDTILPPPKTQFNCCLWRALPQRAQQCH